MRRLPFMLVLLGVLPAASRAALLRVDVTYTDGHVISGPLSADLDALPQSVFASFTLTGPAGTSATACPTSHSNTEGKSKR